MNGEWERNWKKVAMEQSRYYHGENSSCDMDEAVSVLN
jgi:hypothetical protein